MTNHDSIKVAMGATRSNLKDVSPFDADPASFPAGFAVRRSDDGGLQIADDNVAGFVGVSLGEDLSNTKRTSVCRTGLQVPLRLKRTYATGLITITNYANLVNAGDDEITVGDVTFVAQAGVATLGDATFQAASSDEATAASLAAQINAHEDLAELVLATVVGDAVTVTALSPGEDGNLALTYSDEGTATVGATVSGSGTMEGGEASIDDVVVGEKVYVDEVTGDAVDSDDDAAVETAAFYASGILTGVYLDGTTADVALINMPGGL